MIIFVWLLLTLPSDRLVCDLWTAQIPTQTALMQTCGTDALGDYTLHVTRNNADVCVIPAADLASVMTACNLPGRLDDYRLRIVEPNYQELIGCTVETPTNVQPSAQEVKRQCPKAVNYEIRNGGTKQTALDAGATCKPPPPPMPATIATSKELHLLAGRMIWYGYAKADCPQGLSGVHPVTLAALPCGMDGAKPKMIAWQNQLDPYILASSAKWNVPAVTLKQLIESESQYWSWTGVNGEHGMIQITDSGADVLLRIYERGYYQLTDKQRENARAAFLNSLDCPYCTPKQTIEKAANDMDRYAQTLAAYYCAYGNWNAALTAWNVRYKQ